jgi:hypothetical protein
VHWGIVALPPLQVIPVVKALALYFKDFFSVCSTLKWCRLQPHVANLQVYQDKLVQSDTPVSSHHQNKGASSTHPPGPESWSRIAQNDQIKFQQQKALWCFETVKQPCNSFFLMNENLDTWPAN